LVRRADYEGYLTSLFLPSTARSSAVAIRAFNVETAFVKSAVSKPELGLMRLAWWQQRVDEAFRTAAPVDSTQNPVVDSLTEAIAHSSFTKGWFSRLIDERMRQLEHSQPATIADVERTAENIHSSLLYLLLESLGVKHVDADHIASHIGVATGIVTLLRALPLTLPQADVQLPQDIMAKHSLSKERLVRSLSSSAPEHADPAIRKQLADCVFDVAVVAKSHVDHARTLLASSKAPAIGNQVFLSAVPVALFLERLERANFDCFASELHQRPFALYWRLFQCGFRRLPW
jgi:NADH dehydrogenase [ubiquinone] 1 alpha subcomplex assembly factor 6